MRRLTLSLLLLFVVSSLLAQNTTRFEIKSLPVKHPDGSNIYAAGSFNNWNPRDENYRFITDNKGNYFLEIKLNAGSYEYKITRGGWDKVECRKNGGGMGNRSMKVEGNATIELNIEDWQDQFPAKPRVSSASKNVQVMTKEFWIPQLNTMRRVWVYLPADYSATKKRYPVLYMHDGQNVFEDTSSYAGEWGVDEFLDSTIGNSCIVVAIDNGGLKRMNEYCPYDMQRFGKGEGDMYVDFLAKTLKPAIDKKYRTIKNSSSTWVAGSSMGGLISMYAILKYPKVFGGAGVFSPAFWVGPKIFDDITAKGKKVKGKIYFYAGKQEGESMVPDMLKAFEKMAAVSKSKMTTVIRDEGKHNEPTWRMEFPLFYEWMVK
jgi:predicted alpha/beta superfamily hydrolase